MVKRFLVLAGVSLALAGCQDDASRSTRHLAPIPSSTLSLMSQKGMSKNDPILVRAYKKESELEVWKRGGDGRYALLKTYPICRWSGQLGPKMREGDRQAPEGFYTITPAQMNPNSAYYLSFDTGYPNAYDRSLGRTGAHLMVHGTCSSSGCFAMTDEAIAEVYAVAREAFASGQRGFQFQSYPFRMTAENLAKHRQDPNIGFWKNLKEGADYFEVTKDEPSVGVCGRRYVFGGSDVAQGSCAPQVDPAVAERRERDERQVADLVAKGTPALKVVYEDGSQHESFRSAMGASAESQDGSFALLGTHKPRNLGDVSRPEALAQGPREIPVEVPGKAKRQAPSTALAYAAAAKPGVQRPAKPTAEAQLEAKPKRDGAERTAALARAGSANTQTPSEPTASSAGESKPEGRPEGRPLYRRVIGNLLGGTPEPEPAQAADAAAPQPTAPVPPRRKASSPAVKPQAAAPAPRTSQPVVQAGLTAPTFNP